MKPFRTLTVTLTAEVALPDDRYASPYAEDALQQVLRD